MGGCSTSWMHFFTQPAQPSHRKPQDSLFNDTPRIIIKINFTSPVGQLVPHQTMWSALRVLGGPLSPRHHLSRQLSAWLFDDAQMQRELPAVFHWHDLPIPESPLLKHHGKTQSHMPIQHTHLFDSRQYWNNLKKCWYVQLQCQLLLHCFQLNHSSPQNSTALALFPPGFRRKHDSF